LSSERAGILNVDELLRFKAHDNLTLFLRSFCLIKNSNFTNLGCLIVHATIDCKKDIYIK